MFYTKSSSCSSSCSCMRVGLIFYFLQNFPSWGGWDKKEIQQNLLSCEFPAPPFPLWVIPSGLKKGPTSMQSGKLSCPRACCLDSWPHVAPARATPCIKCSFCRSQETLQSLWQPFWAGAASWEGVATANTGGVLRLHMPTLACTGHPQKLNLCFGDVSHALQERLWALWKQEKKSSACKLGITVLCDWLRVSKSFFHPTKKS
jgi:hypothetical protein